MPSFTCTAAQQVVFEPTSIIWENPSQQKYTIYISCCIYQNWHSERTCLTARTTEIMEGPSEMDCQCGACSSRGLVVCHRFVLNDRMFAGFVCQCDRVVFLQHSDFSGNQAFQVKHCHVLACFSPRRCAQVGQIATSLVQLGGLFVLTYRCTC